MSYDVGPPRYYWLNADHTVSPVDDVLDWADPFEERIRTTRVDGEDPWRVARTEVGSVTVSTVFLGLDHQYADGPPLLFETMVFPDCEDCWRYSTWDEAERGHAQVVDELRTTTRSLQ